MNCILKRLLSTLFVAETVSLMLCGAQSDSAVTALSGDTGVISEMPVQNRNRQPLSVKFDVRADWEYHVSGQEEVKDESGFAGKFLNIIVDGNINKNFSYHLRHRINKQNLSQDFFEATDWAYLKYKVNDSWEFLAGKYVVGIGGFEYDKAPIDVYYYSMGDGNMPACYEFGVAGKYTTKDGRSSIFLQVSNSPYTSKSYRFDGLYAYNLMWYGSYGVFSSIYSVNMIEYAPSKYINYIALGNKFDFGPVSWYIDYLNRYALKGSFFGDFSVISRLTYNIMDRVNVFVKGGFDFNNVQAADTPDADIWDSVVVPGTKHAFYGAGVEFFPMKNSKDVRIHAVWNSSNDNFNAHNISIGFRWLLRAYEQ